MHDTRTQRYEAACRNIYVPALGSEPQTATNSLDTDGAFDMVRGKRGAFFQSHECNSQGSLLDQSLAGSASLGIFGKFSKRVIFRSQHECEPLARKSTNSKHRRFSAPRRVDYLLHKVSS